MSRFYVGFETELPLGNVKQKIGEIQKSLYKYYFELIPEFQEHFTQECVWKFIHNKSA